MFIDGSKMLSSRRVIDDTNRDQQDVPKSTTSTEHRKMGVPYHGEGGRRQRNQGVDVEIEEGGDMSNLYI